MASLDDKYGLYTDEKADEADEVQIVMQNSACGNNVVF